MIRLLYLVILIVLLPSCFLLVSCGSQAQNLPDGNIDVDSDIYIVPIGDVDEKYLTPLVPKLEKRFKTRVYVALDKRRPEPDYAYDFDANKYVAMYILSELIKNVEVPEGAKVLGITNVEIFVPESGRPFVFGQAQYGQNSKAAIISTLRMDPNSYVDGKPNDELLIRRMIKEAIHELGHVFGLRNSADPLCVMYLPKDVKELDKKSDGFSSESQREFSDLKKSAKSGSRKD